MKIGAVAELLNTSVQTLRFYEGSGLLEPKRTAGGTRYFDERGISRIKVIQALTDLGLPHKQIKRLADARLMSKTGDESSRAVVGQIKEISENLSELRNLIDHTIKDIESAESFVEQCFGCKKTPRKEVCKTCDVTKNINSSEIISLIWDE